MILEKGLSPGTVIENLKVIRIARANPLLYLVQCMRPDCLGEFELDHLKLTGLPVNGFCAWRGCSEAETERRLRDNRPQPMRVKQGFDRGPLEGQAAYNVQVLSRDLSADASYWVKCVLCKTQWREKQIALLSMTGYRCPHNALCRLEMERALYDAEKQRIRKADAALSHYGGY
jgi:hypothetical protein